MTCKLHLIIEVDQEERWEQTHHHQSGPILVVDDVSRILSHICNADVVAFFVDNVFKTVPIFGCDLVPILRCEYGLFNGPVVEPQSSVIVHIEAFAQNWRDGRFHLALKELCDVEDGADKDNGDNVLEKSSFAGFWTVYSLPKCNVEVSYRLTFRTNLTDLAVVNGVMNGDISLESNCNRHKNGPGDGNR